MCRREMKLECPMLTSTEPCEEFRPMVTDLFFIRYSNSRPSSRATDPDIGSVRSVGTCKWLKGIECFFFWFCEKGGFQFYTVENLAKNVPDRGHSGSDPPPRRRGKESGVDQSNRPNERKYCERQPVKPMGSRHDQADVWCLPMTTIIKNSRRT